MTPKGLHGASETEASADEVKAAERAFQRSVYVSRLMLAAFFTVAVITIVWAIPWFPYGTSVEDYNSRVAMMTLLGSSAAVFAFTAVRLRQKIRGVESRYLMLSSIRYGLGHMRRREYFYDRLLLECDRAKQNKASFTVVVLRARLDGPGPAGATAVQRLVEVLEPLAKEYDWLAPIGTHEVAMFAPKVPGRLAEAYGRDLLTKAQDALDLPGVHLVAGWAAYGPELDEAGEVLGQARQMAAREGTTELFAA